MTEHGKQSPHLKRWSPFRLLDWISGWPFSRKLGLALILFAVFPSYAIYRQAMTYYQQDMIRAASQNVHSIVKLNNTILDTALARVEDASYTALNNQTFYDGFSQDTGEAVSGFLRLERLINPELVRLFSLHDILFAYNLYTSRWIYGPSQPQMRFTADELRASGFLDLAGEANGQTAWITGYEYSQYFQTEYLKDRDNYEYRYPLTMVRQMNFYCYNSGVYTGLSHSRERPVLIVHILESSIRALYDGTVNYDGERYAVINEEGRVISSNSGAFPVADAVPGDMAALSGDSGYMTYAMDGRDYLLCYDSIRDRGWVSVSLIPMEILADTAAAQVQRFQLWATVVLILAAILVSALLSAAIAKPVRNLTLAAKRVARGDFSADTPVPRGADFKLLTESFNHMETQITQLIAENVEIGLREKDSQIQSLSMQINPHFLYNTLNTINMLAIRNGDFETAELIVDLSDMLHFTFSNTSEKIPLVDELHWTGNYLRIMAKRYSGLFDTAVDIPDNLLHYKVPKFSLQPLLENSVKHGFSQLKSGGKIEIAAWQEDDRLHLVVADNGRGMEEDAISCYINGASRDGGIGVSNIFRRLMLLYGEQHSLHVTSAPGKGTRLELVIPLET